MIHSIDVLLFISGHITLDEMMTRLMHAVEVFQEQKQTDVVEEVCAWCL